MAEAAGSAQEKKKKEKEKERDVRLSCRFYEQDYPEVGQCVMVEVRSVAETGACVSLIEFNNIEGVIMLPELSQQRFRSINKVIRVGKLEVAKVIRADKDRDYIYLSKRRVARKDIVQCEERHCKAVAVQSIMRHLAATTNSSLEDLNKRIAWPLSKVPYKDTYDAFRLAILDPERVFKGLEVEQSILEQLMTVVRRKLAPQPVKIRAEIEVICYDYEGIDAIRAALEAGEEAGTQEIPIKIKLIAPPRYVMLATSLEKKAGFDVVTNAIERVRVAIAERKGNLKVAIKPHVTSNEVKHVLYNAADTLGDNTLGYRTIVIPKHARGHVIGSGGRTLKEFQAWDGITKVVLTKRGRMTVTGSYHAVNAVIEDVEGLCEYSLLCQSRQHHSYKTVNGRVLLPHDTHKELKQFRGKPHPKNKTAWHHADQRKLRISAAKKENEKEAGATTAFRKSDTTRQNRKNRLLNPL